MLWLRGQQIFDLGSGTGCQAQSAQARQHTRTACAAGLAVFDIAGQLARLNVDTPDGGLARAAGDDAGQLPTLKFELAGAQAERGGQIGLQIRGCVGASGCADRSRGGRGCSAPGQRLPRINVEARQVDKRRDTTLRHRRGLTRPRPGPERDHAAQHARLRAAQVTQITQLRHVAQAEFQPVLQGPPRRRRFSDQRVVEFHRQIGVSRLAERRGQIERQTAQAAGHGDFGLALAKAERGAVAGAAAGVLGQARHPGQVV